LSRSARPAVAGTGPSQEGIVYRTVRAPAPDWNAGMAFQTGIDAAVNNALAEAGRSLRDV
jgi:hypothetical protein